MYILLPKKNAIEICEVMKQIENIYLIFKVILNYSMQHENLNFIQNLNLPNNLFTISQF